MKIMIADDNLEISETIKLILSSLNANFYQFGNGQDVVAEYKRIRPNWVLMDICMSELDGFQAARMIKDFDPNAKVIIVTNYGDKEYRAEARKLNVNGYIMKEDLSQLRAIIK